MIKEGEKIKEESKVYLAFKEIVQMTTMCLIALCKLSVPVSN